MPHVLRLRAALHTPLPELEVQLANRVRQLKPTKPTKPVPEQLRLELLPEHDQLWQVQPHKLRQQRLLLQLWLH